MDTATELIEGHPLLKNRKFKDKKISEALRKIRAYEEAKRNLETQKAKAYQYYMLLRKLY